LAKLSAGCWNSLFTESACADFADSSNLFRQKLV
jgi:hypothetical protein